MSSPGKVLSTIGALNTLVENFPMSILDLLKGKTYNSVFEFIMDVLYACGVDTNKIVSYLLDALYSINPEIEGSLEYLQEKIASADFKDVQQSAFLMTLEDGIKAIIKAVLASMYGCSAVPVIPNKVMDTPNMNTYGSNINVSLWNEYIYPGNFDIPVKLIDPMGLLEITPTTKDGRAYY